VPRVLSWNVHPIRSMPVSDTGRCRVELMTGTMVRLERAGVSADMRGAGAGSLDDDGGGGRGAGARSLNGANVTRECAGGVVWSRGGPMIGEGPSGSSVRKDFKC
jgi:hypothetical protein